MTKTKKPTKIKGRLINANKKVVAGEIIDPKEPKKDIILSAEKREEFQNWIDENYTFTRFCSLYKVDESNLTKMFKGQVGIKTHFIILMQREKRIKELEEILNVGADGIDSFINELSKRDVSESARLKSENLKLRSKLDAVEAMHFKIQRLFQ